jgi:hypothetical protein
VIAILSVVAVLVVAVWAADRRPTSDPTVGQVVRVGVVSGQSIPTYVQASRRELAELISAPASTETYALVTLTAYLAPDRLTPVLGGLTVAQVFARVPLPDTQTEIVRIPAFAVPADVTSGMSAVATRKLAEAAEYQRLAGQLTGDGDRERELRGQYTTSAQVAGAEAEAYRDRCSCVYAAVVRATPAALQRISTRPEVRAVDPAPEVRRLDRAVFLPPLPEQTGAAHPPSLAPTPTMSVAPEPTPTVAVTSAEPALSAVPSSAAEPSPSVAPSPSG